MTKEALIELLLGMNGGDPQAEHFSADAALIAYIDDPDIARAWKEASETFWYA